MAKVKSKKHQEGGSPSSGATTETMGLGRAEAPEPKQEAGPELHFVYEVPYAPLGSSTLAIVVDGEPVTLEVEDRLVDISGLDNARRKAMQAAFAREGLTNKSFARETPESGAARKAREDRERDFEEAEKEYTIVHPDSTPSHPIDARVSAQVGEETVTLEFSGGKAVTDRADVARAFGDQGFLTSRVEAKGKE